jgi:hypothetical protein
MALLSELIPLLGGSYKDLAPPERLKNLLELGQSMKKPTKLPWRILFDLAVAQAQPEPAR